MDPADSQDVEIKSSETSSFGREWAMNTGNEDSPMINAPANYHLRHQGYVFWDKERLAAFEMYRAPRTRADEMLEFPPGYLEREIGCEMPGPLVWRDYVY